MIEDLKKNIDNEISILKEISNYSRKAVKAKGNEKSLIDWAIKSLRTNLKTINNSIPELIRGVSAAKRLPSKSVGKTGLERVKVKSGTKDYEVTLRIEDREKFIKELNISEELLRKLKKKDLKKTEEKIEGFKKARGYLKLSNRFVGGMSSKFIKGGYFKDLKEDLLKANMDILFQTYVSMIIFTSIISIFAGIIAATLLMVLGLSWYSVIWLPAIFPLVAFVALYVYPSSEKKSIGGKIEQELPFAVIHMSAISGSGIEPTKIFEIIGLSNEYPFLKKEIRKIMNQINLYGYDLVTAVNNVSKSTPSKKFAELLAGLSSTITSGGSLTNFFEKRAESLLVIYRLEREKFTKVAETFMDIYISVVIATPMILLLLLVMISVSGIDIGFTAGQMGIMIIVLIGLINLVFLGILQTKQPIY